MYPTSVSEARVCLKMREKWRSSSLRHTYVSRFPFRDLFGDGRLVYRGTSAFVSVMKDPRISGSIGLSANLEASLFGTWDLTSDPGRVTHTGDLGAQGAAPWVPPFEGETQKGPLILTTTRK